MSLKVIGVIEIPDATGTLFDHGAFDPSTRRVFVAHSPRPRRGHDAKRHIATLPGFPEAAATLLNVVTCTLPIAGGQRDVPRRHGAQDARGLSNGANHDGA